MTRRPKRNEDGFRWAPIVSLLLALGPLTVFGAQPATPTDKAVRIGTDAGAAPSDETPSEHAPGTRHGLPGEAYAVVIGIGTFQDSRINPLTACHADAKRIYDLLVDPEKGDFKKENVRLLVPETMVSESNPKGYVRRADVLKALRWVQQRAGEDDTVIIYFSGHGEVDAADGNKGYWIMGDTRIDELYDRGLSELDITDQVHKIRARRLVTFVDACYANATVGEAGGNDDRPVRKSLTDDPNVKDHVLKFTGEGRVIFAASDGSTPSLVVPAGFRDHDAVGYSLFTYHLTKGLAGAADRPEGGGNGDGVVELAELVEYVSTRTLEDSEAIARMDVSGHTVPHRPVLKGELTARFLLTTDFEALRKRTQIVEQLKERVIDLLSRDMITPENFRDALRLAEADPEALSKADLGRREVWLKIARGSVDDALVPTLIRGMYGGSGAPPRTATEVPPPSTDTTPTTEPKRDTLVVRVPSGNEDAATLVRLLADGAAGGDPDAMFFLGRAHWHAAGGVGVDDKLPPVVSKDASGWLAAYAATVRSRAFSPSFDEAVALLTKAARAGQAAAAFDLGSLLDNGIGVTKDEAKAAEWYEQAAEAGHPVAMRYLGTAAQKRGDTSAAVRWLKRAAEAKDAPAAHQLGWMYQQGEGVSQDYREARRWYSWGAEFGYAPSMNQLAHLYEAGLGVDRNMSVAGKWYWRGANADEPSYTACLNYAYLCLSGDGVDQDDAEAVRWFRKAADGGGLTAAMNQLGLAYYRGRGVGQDYGEALRYFRMAADKGDTTGMYNVGWCYANGRGTNEDQSRAFDWFRQSAEGGYLDSMVEVAERYEDGKGTRSDQSQALTWYRKAADKGSGKAMNRLGLVYEEGRLGVRTDDAEATRWFLRAAEAGYDWGMYNLAGRLAAGTGTDKDEDGALDWYRKAADAGLVQAMNRVGLIYDNGSLGVSEDEAEATYWYRKAAEAGYDWGMYNLAIQYEQGEGVEKSPETAFEWYLKAAQAGNSDAMYAVGRCYLQGTGTRADDTLAFEWYRKAANAGNADAMNAVGFMYDNGTGGVAEDEAAATEWYRKAAEAGSTTAMYNLAIQLELGEGIAEDRPEALYWYRKAARLGHQSSQDRLKNLGESW